MSMNYADTSLADSAAHNTYYQALARGQDAGSANAAATLAWQKVMDTANQTGMWNGQYNMPSQQYFAGAFGQWMPQGPQAGQQTLAGQQQGFQQGQDISSLYGQYYAPGTAPTQGQQTLQGANQAQQLGLSQAGLTGYYVAPGQTGQGQQTLQGQQQQWSQAFQQQQFAAQQQQLQQTNAQAYLQQLAQLRGPADWAKYQQVLGATPNGMRDLAAAAMGQYTPGGGATTGQQPQAANLNTMQAQIGGYAPGYGYGNQGYQQAQAGYTPPGGYAPSQQGQQYQLQGGDAGLQAAQQLQQQGGYNWGQPAAGSYGAPQQAWGSGIGIGGNQATPAQQQQAQGNGTNMYGGQQQQYNLPAPNQIAAQSWNNMAPSQQQMLLGQYEANGWDKGDVTALYNQSLPKYAQNSPSAGTWRLQ